MELQSGSILELNARAGDPLNLVANGCLLARGEVVIANQRFGIRITDVVSPAERSRNLRSS
jgi:flagellar motor switch protein FliN/FliY